MNLILRSLVASLVATTVVVFLAACGGGNETPISSLAEQSQSRDVLAGATPGNGCTRGNSCSGNSSRVQNFGTVLPNLHCSVDFPGPAACSGAVTKNCRTCPASGGNPAFQLCNRGDGAYEPPPEQACSGNFGSREK